MTNHPYISEILHGLTSSGLDYCIQNGYEDMPESFPTDIDIFYRNATEKDLDGIVMNITRNCGLLVMQKVAMGYYHFVYWLTPELPEPGFQLELDFQSELSKWDMPHYYLPSKLLDRKLLFKGFYIPAPIDEIIYTLLRRTVKHNFTQRHLDVLKKDFSVNPEILAEQLRAELPNDIVDALVDIVKRNDINLFEQYYSLFHRYVVSESKKHNTLNKKLSQGFYNIRRMLPLRFIRPCGMDIALLSPDGGGKSTILEALKAYQITGLESVERKYIRPGLFQNIGQYKPNAVPEPTDNPDPHGRKPDGAIKSWIRFLIYLVDFTLGYFIKVVPLKWKRQLVVFDRYYYDYYVDMYRYHYSLPAWVPHFFSILIPHPDLTFILYAPAEVLYARKKELTLGETQRQCEAFKQVAQTTKKCTLVDVNRPVKEVVEFVVKKIIEKRVELTARKLKIK
jgi:hypothetical protein